jgi:hypothetical protein
LYDPPTRITFELTDEGCHKVYPKAKSADLSEYGTAAIFSNEAKAVEDV